MQQDEIIEMLRASCDKDRVDPEQNGFWVIVTEELEAFAKLVEERTAAKEREACAQVAFSWNTAMTDLVAKEIRAHGETTLRGEA